MRFDLSYSGPGFGRPGEEFVPPKSPEPGDVTAVIVFGKRVVRKTTNGVLGIFGWAGGSLGTTGNMTMLFDWLPADFEDYWVRIDMKGKRHFFLIPYGLGSNPATNGSIEQIVREGPEFPVGAKEADLVHTWRYVEYEFARAEGAEMHVSAYVQNAFHTELTELSVTIYRDNGGWGMTKPRTTAVFIRPNGSPRVGSLKTITRPDRMRRRDTFEFGQIGLETRSWVFVRVTVEEEVFEITVPGSLYFYTHGWLPRK